MPALIESRDAAERDFRALEASVQRMIKPLIEQVLTDEDCVYDGYVGGMRRIMSVERIHQKIARQFPKITEQDISKTLWVMASDGWVNFDSFCAYLFLTHHCNIEDGLEFVSSAEGNGDPMVYQCLICGEGWTSRIKKRHRTQRHWKRGADLTWNSGSIQAQRAKTPT